jgi:hypothetical protein
MDRVTRANHQRKTTGFIFSIEECQVVHSKCQPDGRRPAADILSLQRVASLEAKLRKGNPLRSRLTF